MFHKGHFSKNRLAHVNFRSGATALGMLIAVLMCCTALHAQTVATYDFEDGTADGWSSFNGASTPTATTVTAYTGTHSLVTTTSTSGAGGPSISVGGVLTPGAQYTITGYVKLQAGENPGSANFSVKRSDPSCTNSTCYDTIGTYQVPVTSSGWAQIGGTYTVSPTETGLTLYAQLVGATSAQTFYLDDVVITETAPPPGGTPVASYTFSDGGLDGWAPVGPVTLTNAPAPLPDPNGDTRSLLASNRTAPYAGPGLNLLGVNNIVAGATYQVTAYVLLAAPDSTNPTVTISTRTTDCASSTGVYNNAATSGPLSNTVWTKVQGTFSYSDLPGPPSSLILYLQSSSATDSFYVGDVVITQVGQAPVSVSQQDNTGITSTFEDGGLDGWTSRTGNSKLQNTTATAHTGTHSLMVTGRTANYDGPQISVSDKMYVGSVYNVSVWVKLAVADNSSHILNMSLQTTLNGNTSYSSVTAYPGITVTADGNWHQLQVMGYNMSSGYDPGQAYLYVQTVPASGSDLVSFYMDDFELSYVSPPRIQTNIPSIYKTLQDYFHVGAEVDMTDISGPHEQLATMHFNSITSGNDMKWSSVEASPGTYDFANADAEVGMAVCHNMLVRGQNLVWATGAQTPSYAFGDGTNSATNQSTVISNIQEHIQSEVQHFGKEVYGWDVVNEPIDPSQPDCLAHGPFYNVLGAKYIDVAFQAARKYAPPGTKLFINEYSTADPAKLACLVKVVHELRDRGVPVDAIGHEMHNNINYPSIDAMRAAFTTVAENFPGIDQQVTELDESVYNAGDIKSNYGNNVPASVLAEQGWLYKQYFDLFREMRGVLSSVTLWGMADDDTWLDGFPVTRTDYPLPFDMHLQAKPAYWGIVDPTHLPGYGLTFAVAPTSDDGTSRIWKVTATNGDVGPAYTTEISGFTLRQTEGKPCTPVVTPPGSFPVLLGDIATGASATASFKVDFSSCGPVARFIVEVPWSSATYDTGKLVNELVYRKDNDHPVPPPDSDDHGDGDHDNH
jgi:endo-1,4-beta-xylanase